MRGAVPPGGRTIARRTAPRPLLALALALGLLGLSPALADTKQELDAARAELAEIQQEADAATAEWHAAIVALEQTKAEAAEARARIAGLEQKLERIDQRLARRAVVAFTNGPASTIDLLLSSSSITELSDRLEFLGSVAQDDVDLALEQENAQEDLRRERDDLLALSERQAEEAAQLNEALDRVNAELARMSDRVADLTAEYREELAAEKALTAIGQTPNANPDPSSPLQRCPVAGPNSFVDSFGWPRVGHTHQGIDMISPFGTPVVAAHPGTASFSSSSSGGLQAYVRAPSGTYTFYAHLSSYGNGGSVGAGTVIGYVGSTGNAGSTNHLHFEYHPGGGAAINPYQMLLAVC
ncbi:MAG TPA: peptidoglycan DD-metalloendopeptidase family protein [Actinomycetota bacterium]|jgi:murein DD-endopeptidase MepM/ murein hydrolase activator NlpD